MLVFLYILITFKGLQVFKVCLFFPNTYKWTKKTIHKRGYKISK